jgi:crotonobetainyl-CoA:carnitine CoA-transferase CaiB-like acyl-CoA transferase
MVPPAAEFKNVKICRPVYPPVWQISTKNPEVGTRIHAGIPWHMSGTPCEVQAAAPLRGQHTDYVLRDILEISDAEVQRLRDGQVLY